MSIKEEVKDEIEERLSKGCDEPTSFNKCGKKYTDGKVYYCEFCLGRIKQHKETKQKMIKEFKEMIDKKLEGFKKVRQGIIGNTKVLTAYNCFIAHLEELKSQVDKGK